MHPVSSSISSPNPLLLQMPQKEVADPAKKNALGEQAVEELGASHTPVPDLKKQQGVTPSSRNFRATRAVNRINYRADQIEGLSRIGKKKRIDQIQKVFSDKLAKLGFHFLPNSSSIILHPKSFDISQEALGFSKGIQYLYENAVQGNLLFDLEEAIDLTCSRYHEHLIHCALQKLGASGFLHQSGFYQGILTLKTRLEKMPAMSAEAVKSEVRRVIRNYQAQIESIFSQKLEKLGFRFHPNTPIILLNESLDISQEAVGFSQEIQYLYESAAQGKLLFDIEAAVNFSYSRHQEHLINCALQKLGASGFLHQPAFYQKILALKAHLERRPIETVESIKDKIAKIMRA